MDSVKKILVIKEKVKNKYYKANEQVEQFLNNQKNRGYDIVFEHDYFSNVENLLSGEIIFNNKEIYSNLVNCLVNVEDYEYIIYIPMNIEDISQATVFYTDKIDRGNLYNSIANMHIVNDIDLKRIINAEEIDEKYVDFHLEKDDLEISNNDIEKEEISDEFVYRESSEVNYEIDDKINGKRSFLKKTWIILPWIFMLVMSVLRYNNIVAFPFCISVLYYIYFKLRYKKEDSVIEFMSLIFIFLTMVVNFIYTDWINSVGIILSIMGITLFTILNSMEME